VTTERDRDRRLQAVREAARLLDAARGGGRSLAIEEAIRLAAARAGIDPAAISAAEIRDHARGVAMAELGDEGYRRRVAEILGVAESAMTLLEMLPGEPRTVLVGRAAKGQVDADPFCRIRIASDQSSAVIAARLVEAGYEEPSFGTVATRFGRLERLVLVDDGVELRITRCPPAMRIPVDGDLRGAGRVPALDLDGVRETIAELSRSRP
jgi:hypothetical protein